MLFLHALLEIRAAPCKGMGSARPLEHQGCCRGDATSVAMSWHVTSAWPPSRGGCCIWGTPTSWHSRAGHAACRGARCSPKPRQGLGKGDGEGGGGGERGEEPAKHHSGLHFIAMATSWKPYRIGAAEHQIREAAAGRTLAPHARSRAPQVLGDRVSGEPGGPFPPLVRGTASQGSFFSSRRVQDAVPCALSLFPPSFHPLHQGGSPATAPVILEKS